MAMQHSRQDAIDARTRAAKNPTPNRHPILAAVEVRAGLWHMVDQYNPTLPPTHWRRQHQT
ncbi:hypothetical protein [Salinibacterium sp. ZJ450]|uniref:hypothetical protein n=1 Tax=Salinibacterium sp. ZJ450 TaxID=2708338 RepID=UPI00141EE700|nr:hypothetical protein [Salinibacterium sp. ZJ450]